MFSDIYSIRRIEEVKEAIKDIFSDFPPYQRLLTIPGVGPMVAATFLAEIGDINCYDYADQIIKLAGLDLASIQSGKYQSQRKISKRGKVNSTCIGVSVSSISKELCVSHKTKSWAIPHTQLSKCLII